MKRQSLLICNNDASGAQHDIDKWRIFLQSTNGGCWHLCEIESMVNPSLEEVEEQIRRIRYDNYDFVIVVYAGHGEWERSTNIELNPQGETISEEAFNNLATRQINCFDCCRGTGPSVEMVDEARERMFSASQRSTIREIYDNRMMYAYPQQINLYACQVGESAYGDDGGGYYTNNLLRYATDFLPGSDFQTINRAHNIAALLTTAETSRKVRRDQHPDMIDSRVVSSRQLIIGISTRCFRII